MVRCAAAPEQGNAARATPPSEAAPALVVAVASLLPPGSALPPLEPIAPDRRETQPHDQREVAEDQPDLEHAARTAPQPQLDQVAAGGVLGTPDAGWRGHPPDVAGGLEMRLEQLGKRTHGGSSLARAPRRSANDAVADRCPACNRQLVFRLEFDRQG